MLVDPWSRFVSTRQDVGGCFRRPQRASPQNHMPRTEPCQGTHIFDYYMYLLTLITIIKYKLLIKRYRLQSTHSCVNKLHGNCKISRLSGTVRLHLWPPRHVLDPRQSVTVHSSQCAPRRWRRTRQLQREQSRESECQRSPLSLPLATAPRNLCGSKVESSPPFIGRTLGMPFWLPRRRLSLAFVP